MGTVFKISVLRLWNNRQELVLVFLVPIMFFSIFALIFSRGVGVSLAQVRVSFVDDDKSDASRALIKAACARDEIQPVAGIWRTSRDWSAEKLSKLLISQKSVEVVVHIPAGFTTQDPQAPHLSIGLFNEGTNPIAQRIVQAGLAESIAMLFAEANMVAVTGVQPAVAKGNESPVNPAVGDSRNTEVRRASTNTLKLTETEAGQSLDQPVVFQSIDAFASNKHQPKIAMYAAGIAIMFLLFSASGTGASLLEEREAGTLGRLLATRLSVTELMLGKWLYAVTLGTVQLIVMFAWGQLVFQVDLLGHLPGFAAMTIATTAACASFALFLATICRSRQQLHAVSVVLVLSMSAVGGSMIPRYIMSDSMKSLGKLTFNGWALDGFQKVFWYDLPITALRTELCVLASIAIVLGAGACHFAQRWSKL